MEHAQSYLTLCDPMDCSLPDCSVYGIFQEYWSGLPCPTPGNLSDLEIEHMSPVFPALAGRFFTIEPPEKPIEVMSEWKSLSHVWLFVTLWVGYTIHGFSRQ